MLSATSLRLGYEDRVVLRDVSIDVAAGDAVALLGPNGAGKTTLLRALAGLISPLSGEARVDGRPVGFWRRRDLARRVAYVPQETSLLFPFRVSEVVLMGRYAHRKHGFATFETAEDLRALRVALEQVDLWDRRQRRFDELSGGERRRVLLAQALCQEAACVLLDEPTDSLDAAHVQALLGVLEEQRKGTNKTRALTVLVATHDLSLAARLCSRAYLLGDGEIAAQGPTLEVLSSPVMERVFSCAFFLGRVPATGRPFCVPQ